MNKTSILLAGLAATIAATPAMAEDSPHVFTGNVGLYSQYIFRGLTQTNEDPALQGGFDYSYAPVGFYVGLWGSNISWLRDGGTYNGGASAEIDVYGGFRGNFGKSDFTYDVGILQYWYPGDTIAGAVKADTTEVYGGLGWKWLSAKYSYVVSNKAFGVANADGTWYLDLGASVPLGESGFTLGLHYGIQEFDGTVGGVSNDSVFSYEDYKISLSYDLSGVSKALSGATIGAMYTDTSGAPVAGYGSVAQGGVYPKNIADSQFTVWFSKTF